jgi:hypothetical protein
MATLNEVAVAAEAVPADTDVAWTGRTMKVPWFAEHMREELVLHGWDITGDGDFSAAFQAALAEPWMTTHSVFAVGRPLLAKGAKEIGSGERIEARLRVPDTDDVFVSARRIRPPSDSPTRWGRPRWKPMPRHGFCCSGAADRATRQGSAAAPAPKPWVACAGY